MRRDIAFETEDGITLRGWFYQPAGAGGSAPTVVMAHGFSGLKESLTGFAEVFREAGLGVLVYDNRNYGASDGMPRLEVDPYRQVADYRDAITFATTLDGVDPDRIGIWGTSYSGGHVLAVGANDRRVRCVVSQVPLVSGHRNAARAFRRDGWAELQRRFVADRAARARGAAPAMIPIFSDDPTVLAALPPPVKADFLQASFDDAPAWRNEVTLRSVEMFSQYEPASFVPFLSPTPLMMIVANNDRVTMTELALEAFAGALEPKALTLLAGGHFPAYERHYETASTAARDWFQRHLIEAAN